MARKRGKGGRGRGSGSGRVTPKGTRPRNWNGGGPAASHHGQQEPDIILEIRQELRQPDAFGLLAYVSRMATLHDPRMDDPWDRESSDNSQDLAPLLDMFANSGEIETAALVVAFAELAVTEEQRNYASKLAAELGPRHRMGFPAWLRRLGEARAVRAVSQHDHGGDFSNEILEIDVAGHPVVMLANVDHNSGHSLFDGYPAPASIDDVVRLAEVNDELPIMHTEVGLAESAARIQYAIDRDVHTVPRCETETWPGSRAMFDWAVRVAGPAEQCDFDYVEPDESLQHELEGRFLQSPFGREAAKLGATAHLDTLWWYAASYGHAQPLVFGPQRAWVALTDWFPRKVMCPPEEARSFPELLRAWIRFAHAETGVPPTFTDYVFEAVTDAEQLFFEQIGDEDRPLGLSGALSGAGILDLLEDPDDLWPGVDGTFQERLAEARALTAARVRAETAESVGIVNYETFSVDALPDESFDGSGTEADIGEALDAWVAEIGRMCDALFDSEVRTACFRLLRSVARADPEVFRRRARVDRGVVALVWIIGTANELFFTHLIDDGPSVMVSDLTGFFDAPKSGHTTRAGTLLKAIGVQRREYGEGLFLGDPDVLTGAHRRRLATRRKSIATSSDCSR